MDNGVSDRPLAERANNRPIEEIRVLATLLLVIYHVIGGEGTGLNLSYPHPMRIFADMLADFRMPAFAFLSGFVYALHPPRLTSLHAFYVGKLRRIAVPGIIAALSFEAAALLLDSMGMTFEWMVAPQDIWRLLIFPYLHFWFLQAILTLFVVIGLTDAATRHRHHLWLLAIATLFSLSRLKLPPYFSLDQAAGLAPFFILGICVYRGGAWIDARKAPLTLVTLTVMLACLCWKLWRYTQTGMIDLDRRDIETLAMGAALCLLLIFYIPTHPWAKVIGRVTFTIYLYHVLGTAAARIALNKLGIDMLPVHLLCGVIAGLMLPTALHLIAACHPLTSKLLLGIRSKRGSAPPPPLPPALDAAPSFVANRTT
jgi:fucose 4-O-acetylase-like acetyltransferase